MFIAVGPPSFTCAALIAMAADVPRVFNELSRSVLSSLAGGADPAIMAADARLLAAVFLWGLSFWFFLFAAAAVAAGMVDRKFHLSWFGFRLPQRRVRYRLLPNGHRTEQQWNTLDGHSFDGTSSRCFGFLDGHSFDRTSSRCFGFLYATAVFEQCTRGRLCGPGTTRTLFEDQAQYMAVYPGHRPSRDQPNSKSSMGHRYSTVPNQSHRTMSHRSNVHHNGTAPRSMSTYVSNQEDMKPQDNVLTNPRAMLSGVTTAALATAAMMKAKTMELFILTRFGRCI
jgi:hypothetical protein